MADKHLEEQVTDGRITLDAFDDFLMLSWNGKHVEEEIIWFYDIGPSLLPQVDITHNGKLKKRELTHLPQYRGLIAQMDPMAARAIDLCMAGGAVCGAEVYQSQSGKLPSDSFSPKYQSPNY